MTELNTADIARVAAMPAVREAAREAARLIALWPLTDAMRMDNDAKYGENLQVRVTRAFARILTGEDVTVPDAEYVYEGADAIPGRPQAIVDALLAANDAYDALADFSDTGDVTLVDDAAADLGVTWDDVSPALVHATLDAVEAAVNDGTFDAGEYAVAGDDGETGGAAEAADAAAVPVDDDAFEPSPALVDAMAHRFAAALTVCDALLVATDDDSGDAAPAPVTAATPVNAAAVRAVLPLLLVVNELREQISVPRIFLTDVQIRDLLAARTAALADAATLVVGEAALLDATAAFVAPLAAAEWRKHREDVLWDPAAAKKKAKEEDEKRNKAALAAKFAHVKNDNTETVEL
ncbi:hypothetical protein [Bifidobacterium stellenboschense]|uniref:Uncharacterized protein n=1 Tax=Bifidobacterium stellenboschense TaxID=762211 RepID=A0A087DRC5_9BIFI|nr:hypothetical protein [Bifidobacterium stellenboschense]KFI98075.1 hypothetical protein BSTEL_0835 [Bifidobacterium stellenboschense]